jgi:dihydroneopterin aldolase
MKLAAPGVRHVFVRDMVLHTAIGVYAHEHGSKQRVRVNVDLAVTETGVGLDQLDQVVSYELVVKRVRAIAGAGHIKLVETLAERIAAACLEDGRVLRALVRVEKLDVFEDTGSVGVAIERCRLSTGLG